MAAEQTRYAVSVPHLGSLILTHTWNGEIRGLKSFAPEDRPNSLIVFWSFRIMVGLGLLMILLAAVSLWLRKKARLYEAKWFQRCAVLMAPTGFIALLAGWVTTEAGRQPWVVYGLMRTAQAASPVSRQQVGVSLLIFVVVYLLVFGTGIYYLLKLLRKGPVPGEHTPEGEREPIGSGATYSGRRPLSGADDRIDASQEGDADYV
jgi:cytochrome d ubiquinol oxidase subunit I